MTAQPTVRTPITSHPTNDDRSSDREPSLHLMTAPPTRLGHRSRAILHLMTAPLIASLPVHIQQHLMTAQLTVQWTPLPLRYHLTTYTYKNTCLIINNNYLIIQNKTRLHTPSRVITSFFAAGALSCLTAGAPSLLTAGASSFFKAAAPAKPTAGALSFLTA